MPITASSQPLPTGEPRLRHCTASAPPSSKSPLTPSIRPKSPPSAAAATTILALRSSIRCQLRRPAHPLPKPPHRQTPITATAHTAARAFLPWRLSDAGPQHGWVARDGPASETLHSKSHSRRKGLVAEKGGKETFGSRPWRTSQRRRRTIRLHI